MESTYRKRKTKSNKVLEPKCKHCEYKPNNLTCIKVHCLTRNSTKEDRKKNLNIIVRNVILEHTQKYYLHDIAKTKKHIN